MGKAGFQIVSTRPKLAPDLKNDPGFMSVYEACSPYTMTSPERMYMLYQSVKYIVSNSVAGDFVECGVWKGGSSMVIAKTLLLNSVSNRVLYLYDTFEGMSEPSEIDKDQRGTSAKELLESSSKIDSDSIWCYSTIDEVKRNLISTGYPSDKIRYVKGKVEETIPGVKPEKIALLRLDTDWYESTRHELIHLYPHLSKDGVLIIDDYGYWEGARKAVDEYFSSNNIKELLHRIDETGRIMVRRD